MREAYAATAEARERLGCGVASRMRRLRTSNMPDKGQTAPRELGGEGVDNCLTRTKREGTQAVD
jgi:hypothetical protein